MLACSNPCSGAKKNREAGRDVYVEDDLFTKVYRHADQPTRDAMDLAYLTGQRPQDTLRLDERGQRMTLDTLQRRFRETRREASVPDGAFQIRDLRAKAGTDKTDTTRDIRQAQKQPGHTSVTMTEHYVRDRRADKVKPTR